jgi:hypothetical protein
MIDGVRPLVKWNEVLCRDGAASPHLTSKAHAADQRFEPVAFHDRHSASPAAVPSPLLDGSAGHAPARASRGAQARTRHHDLMRAVREAVGRTVRGDGVLEKGDPLVDSAGPLSYEESDSV